MQIWEIAHQLDRRLAMAAHKNFDYNAPHIFFQGERLLPSWQVPEAEMNPAQPGARVVDFPFFEHGALLCSKAAWGVLEPYLRTEVELLPVNVEGYDYVLLNPIRVIDCLNKQQSRMRYYKDGSVTHIDHYVFDETKLKGTYLFKTPELTRIYIYATEALREIVEQHQFTGLEFRDLP